MHGMTNLGEKQHGKITAAVMGSDRQMSTRNRRSTLAFRFRKPAIHEVQSLDTN